MALDIRQPEIPACVSIRESVVVDTEQGKAGGVQVITVYLVVRCV